MPVGVGVAADDEVFLEGAVRNFHFAAGDQVAEGAELVDFEAAT